MTYMLILILAVIVAFMIYISFKKRQSDNKIRGICNNEKEKNNAKELMETGDSQRDFDASIDILSKLKD